MHADAGSGDAVELLPIEHLLDAASGDEQARLGVAPGGVAVAQHCHQRNQPGAARQQEERTADIDVPGEVAADRPPQLELVARAQLVDKNDPRYLQEETLSYLIRRAHRVGEDTLVNDLAEALVERCTRYLKATLRPLQQGKLEEVIADALAEIFEKLVEPAGSDAGDFLQVRFWVVVKRLGWAASKRAVDDARRQSLLVSIEAPAVDFENDGDHALEIADDVTPPVDTQLLSDEALSVLEPNVREAFVLKVEGWPVEDRDPNVMTISRYFGKTSRTIRNWISDAEKQLAAWRDEEAGV
jgi:hypothetical protein